MTIGAGLGGQLGVKAESVFGTAVVVDSFFEFTSEGLGLSPTVMQGQGIRAGGMYPRSRRRTRPTRTAGGPISLEVPTTGAEPLFKQMFGSVTGTTTKTYTPGNLTGQSITIAKAVPQTDGTAKSFVYPGCKIPTWTLSCDTGGVLTLEVEVDARDEVANGSVATASYPHNHTFDFSQGALTLGGVAVANVKSFTATGTSPVKSDRFFFNSAGRKAEQTQNDYPSVTGSLTTEFVDQATIYDLFATDTGAALVLTFTNGPASIALTLPAIFFDGESPKIGGPDVVELTAPFTATDNDTDPVISLAYTPSL